MSASAFMRYAVAKCEQTQREEAYRVYTADLMGRMLGASDAHLYSALIDPATSEEIDVDAIIERIAAASEE